MKHNPDHPPLRLVTVGMAESSRGAYDPPLGVSSIERLRGVARYMRNESAPPILSYYVGDARRFRDAIDVLAGPDMGGNPPPFATHPFVHVRRTTGPNSRGVASVLACSILGGPTMGSLSSMRGWERPIRRFVGVVGCETVLVADVDILDAFGLVAVGDRFADSYYLIHFPNGRPATAKLRHRGVYEPPGS